jgi:hypothetical protein
MIQLQALLLSLAVEAPIVVVGLSAAAPGETRRTVVVARALKLAVGATLLTHPLAWSANAWLAYAGWSTAARLGAVEGLVVAAESALFAMVGRLSAARAVGVALVANAASFAAGWWLG